MGFFKLAGFLSMVPATMMVTVSFFVLFAVSKAEQKQLKAFGWVVAGLLWLCAFVVLTGGMYMSSMGGKFMGKCQMMHSGQGCGMMQMMNKQDGGMGAGMKEHGMMNHKMMKGMKGGPGKSK